MPKHSYDNMAEYLDRYFQGTDISAYSPQAQGFLCQTYYIIKQLMADVQELQQRLDNITEPSRN